MTILLLQLALMLVAAILFGRIARKLGLPSVFGELIGGVVLGPTIFGAFAASAYSRIFPLDPSTIAARQAVIKLGMLFFLFVAGLQVNLNYLKKNESAAVGTSIFGILIPFTLGFALVYLFPGLWQGHNQEVTPFVFALFLGTALSISALPVIAKILMDLNLMKGRFGVVVLASASVDDLIGWTLFSVILWHVQSRLAGAATFGVYAVLGAFLAGVVLRGNFEKSSHAQALTLIALHFFAPLYFVSLGLKTNFAAHFDLPIVLILFFTACAGKISGAVLGASLGRRMPFREALAVGFAMNARGAMEMILASVALEHHLIDETIFVALLVMAMGTSLLSGPAIRRLLASEKN